MISKELVGRRVKVLAWYDHPQLIMARSKDELVGAITHVKDCVSCVSLSVRLDRLDQEYTFKMGDVELLP
jgi:hypothetical protein